MADARIDVGFEALEADTREWRCAGEAQSSLASAVSGLTLTGEHLHPHADMRASAADSHGRFIQELEARLMEAHQASTDASRALRDSKDGYLENERNAMEIASKLLADLQQRGYL